MFRRSAGRNDEAASPAVRTAPPIPAHLAGLVDGAVQARDRWRAVVAGLAPGPLAERLGALGARIDAAVEEVGATAVRVGELERVVETLDPVDAQRAYKAAKRAAANGEPPPELDALEARFTSVQRIMNAAADAEDQLALLDARLRAALAQATEVAVVADPVRLDVVDADVDGVVDELTALRTALTTMV